MERFNRSDLDNLAHVTSDPCVTIYMPTFSVEAQRSQNLIRFRNRLKEARQTLADLGVPSSRAEALLEPAESKLDDEAFWHHQSHGLAAFIMNGSTLFYRVPLQFDELSFVGSRFYLKPLFPLIASNNRFFVLALSQNHIRLFEGTHYSLDEIDSSAIPKDITQALIYDDPERQLQGHSAGRGSGRGGNMIFHGHGGSDGSDDATHKPQDRLHRFFQQVDDGLTETLEGGEAPLLLAGVDYYLPIYRAANNYPHLVDDDILSGNPDHTDTKTLHEKAWSVMQPRFLESQRKALDRYEVHTGGSDGLASSDLAEIVPASRFSRVETLFVPIGAHQWGLFDEDNLRVELHEKRQPGDIDLLDFAALQTYLNGGTVHALRPENMPSGALLAAVFRFPAEVAATQQ